MQLAARFSQGWLLFDPGAPLDGVTGLKAVRVAA